MADASLKPNSMNGLTIIIPCFNCSETIEEAIESIYQQNIEDFEIIAVDDCSTDNTHQILEELSKKYPQLHIYKNEKNLGGGATRNVAVSKAKNELIFCLDSDDMLGKDTLNKMVRYWEEKKCDGIGISTSIKFKGKNIQDVAYVSNFKYVDEIIPLKSLFEKDTCSLYSVFMFTKKAFSKISGYPENHGFDTQGFAFKFLSSGLIAYTCPNTIYLHRIEFHDSYYIREAQSGKINLNWFKILLESLYIFTDSAKSKILDFDLYSNKNIMEIICTEKNILSNTINVPNIPIENYLYSLKKSLHISDSKIKKVMSIYQSKVLPFSFKRVPFLLLQKIKIWAKKSAFKNLFFGIKTRIYLPNKFKNILSFLLLLSKKFLKISFHLSKKEMPRDIDLVFPVTKKDLLNLPHSIKYAKRYIKENIKNIYIVAKKDIEMEDFCHKNNLIFMNEDLITHKTLSQVHFRPNNINRDGWLFQQLLKIGMAHHVQMEDYLVLDSDTILINEHIFFKDEKTILFTSEELHYPYRLAYKNILGEFPLSPLSFVSHMMIFNKNKVNDFIEEIEKKHNKKWEDIIIENTENNMSGFSEYETYGNWMLKNYRKRILLLPFYNKSMQDITILSRPDDVTKLKRQYNSISFHNY